LAVLEEFVSVFVFIVLCQFIKDVIHRQATKYRNRNKNNKNELITALTDVPPVARRLKRHWPEVLLK
jgi:hypothetical protein